MTILQSDGYETGCFNNKIWNKYYCLGKNHVSEALSSKFIRCQNPYQLQNSKILTTLQGHKNLHVECKIFGVGFFYLEEQGYIDITRGKLKLGSYHLHT